MPARMALCGAKYIEFTTRVIAILSINFSYNKQIVNGETFMQCPWIIKLYENAFHSWKVNAFVSY